MALDIKNLFTGFRALPVQKQLVAFLVFASVLGGVVFFALLANRPEFGVLFTNLDSEDAAKVIAKLKQEGIPYKTEAGGRLFLVPVDKIPETRISLASDGIPQSGSVGFEIFDKDNLGTSSFVQEVKFRRALQGELARTIMSLAEVEGARVHLVLPERSPFVGDTSQSPRASVVVKVRKGSQLHASQIKGIVHLVCGSVQGLKSDDVSVIDTEGTLLTGSMDPEGKASLSQTQLEYKDAIESNLEGRVTRMLEGVVGAGKAIVRVSVDVDFRQIEKNEELYDPDKVVIRSEQKRTEKGSGMQTAGGIPGVASNVPGETGGGGTGTSTSPSERKEQIVNYEINRVVSRIVESVGAVKRLSVAVLLHKDKANAAAPGDKAIQDLTALVKSAVGYNEQRGDRVDVAMIPFEMSSEGTEPVAAPGMGEKVERFIPYVFKYGAILIGMAVLVFVVLRPLLRNLEKGGKMIEEIQKSLPQGAEGMTKRLEEKSTTDQFVDLVRKDSGKAAQVVKMWLREG